MRLFTAINFSSEIKDTVRDITEILRAMSKKGNFTLRDNIHLTLAFIGDYPSHYAPLRAVNSVSFEPFSLCFEKLGFFKNTGGDICYLAFKKSKELTELQHKLCVALKEQGVGFDEKEFKPHLTLARQFSPTESFSAEKINAMLPQTEILVERIGLMKSERINGVLKYTEIR